MYKLLFLSLILSFVISQNTSFQSSLPSFDIATKTNLKFEIQGKPSNTKSPFQLSINRLVYLNPSQNPLLLSLSSFFSLFFQQKKTDSIVNLKDFKREFNGSNNNIKYSSRGAAHIPLLRACPPHYQNHISDPISYYKGPRQISNKLGQMRKPFEKSRLNMTMAFTIWGQFLDHDISLTEVNESEAMDIQIPECDQFMDPDCQGQKTIPFKRSVFIPSSEPRQQMNFITAWIDGSQVYGSTKEVSDRLRTFELGKLKEGEDRMLPKREGDPHNLLDAGDVRANENIMLTSYHTIFMREHNRMCEEIVKKAPNLQDEEIYQAARNYVVALLQKITYKDFLPLLLGPELYRKYIGEYQAYDEEINPDIQTEFSTAAYRIGHSLLASNYAFINRYGEISQELSLHEMFFRPSILDSSTISDLFRGLSKTYMKEKSLQVIDDIRNLLISGANERHINLDLYALNLQRDSDHGIPNLNIVREQYGLKKLSSFDELVSDKERSDRLKEAYKSPDECDTWVGIIAEDAMENGVVGELAGKIIGEQFKRLRDGDRYYYEKELPPTIGAQIGVTTFSEVIMRNTGILNLPENIFIYNGD